MTKRTYFKKGDILFFLKTYKWAKRYVISYKTLSPSIKKQQKNDYINAINVVDAFDVFHASLSVKNMIPVSLYVNYPKPSYVCDIINNQEIIENFDEIVLSKKCFRLKELDIKLFGQWLRDKRKMLGLPKIHVAGYLGISEASLRAYEEGRRIMRIDIFYKVLLLYEVENFDFNEMMMK